MTQKNIIELQGVSKHYGGLAALNNIDLNVRDGEILTLLGPSGCGKTTLMRIIAGFDDASTGRIMLAGKDVTRVSAEHRNVNMVFQKYALFPHLDVFDNVAFGLRLKKVAKDEITKQVNQMLELVQLDGFANRWITELSGGQAQRVALARALVNRPDVLLLDEPLAALDLKIRHHMLKELKRIHSETHTTFIYVTHDQDEAMILSDRVVLLNRGAIEQLDTPQAMYTHPKTLFCARFLGETNIFEGVVQDVSNGEASIQCQGGGSFLGAARGVSSGHRVHMSIRPEAIMLRTATEMAANEVLNGMQGSVREVTYIGSRVVYQVDCGNGVSIQSQTPRLANCSPYEVGAAVHLTWHPDAVTVLQH
ncbi:putative spermidine/putrescine transport system ATP-binding protein/spermidine/putrescine transport system ATP-binding protein [Pseudomonas sp. WPR_5_2]|uniref:ABC transporter ATP-binding protein n=1 Tax=Pseudomonas sp. WPR_5_2 TaxID=1907371 RepID=UPI000EAF0A72|nr:ABC transporter ATP-binding protein [Pseudomonas sp. WPR_5_2]RKS18950.1 putative spermidine/putrescine transport system ATP-binding protein/spermidine/putrescine transport system ATP-binding protein [Pseudomonas sp. WPR_5_2]